MFQAETLDFIQAFCLNEVMNTTATAPTESQIDLLRHLLDQFNGINVEQTIANQTTKEMASALIEDCIRNGATKPAAARRPVAKATVKQVDWIMSLIAKGRWHDSDHGQFASAPSRREIEKMTVREASALIEDLRR